MTSPSTLTLAPGAAPGDPAVADAIAVGRAWRDLRRARWASVLGDLVSSRRAGPPLALEAGDVDTLDAIAHHPVARMSDVAAELQVDASTATRAVDRLVQRGLAERRRDHADGRAVTVHLTEEGRAIREALLARRVEFVVSVLDRFGARDRAALVRLLPRLAEAVADQLRADQIDQMRTLR